MPSYGEFLFQRSDRASRLYYVRYPVPRDLQACFKAKRIIRPLGTSSLVEARRKSRPILMELDAMFDAARAGILTPAIIESAARAHYESRLTEYAGEPDAFFQDGDGLPSDADGALMALADWADPEGTAPEKNMTATADALLKGRGLPLDAAGRADLCSALHAAEVYALQHAIAVRDGRIPERPTVFSANSIDRVTFDILAPAPSTRRAKGLKVSKAAERYLAERQEDAGAALSAITVRHRERTFRLFAEHVRDKPLASVTRPDAKSFIDRLGKLSAKEIRRRSVASLSLAELEKRCSGTPTLTAKTLNKYGADLYGLFRWAKKAELFSGDNPFGDQRRPIARHRDTTYLTYEADELQALIAGAIFDKSRDVLTKPETHSTATAMPWMILMSLYGGLRLEEAAGLRVSDICHDAATKVWYFKIVGHPERSIKSEAAQRHVPIHSQLVKRGLLDYVKHVRGQGHDMLFPGLTKIADNVGFFSQIGFWLAAPTRA